MADLNTNNKENANAEIGKNIHPWILILFFNKKPK